MFGRPEEVNATQETQEQGRIAQRSEAAADIGHQEDEENKGVHAVFAVLIGFEQRTNDEHGRTGRSHHIGKQRTRKQKGRIHHRRSLERRTNMNAACHHKQSTHKDNERNVVTDNGVRDGAGGNRAAIDRKKRHSAQQGPSYSDLTEVVMPEVRHKHRAQGNAQQNTGKRNGPSDGKLGAIETGRVGEHRRDRQKRAQKHLMNHLLIPLLSFDLS